MQITVNIDPNLPRWLRRVAMYAGVPAVLVIAGGVYANVPEQKFEAGEELSSAKMTASFKALTDAINVLQGSVDAQQNTMGSLVPSGTVVAFASATVPPGWLACDGSAKSRGAPYKELFDTIKVTHGGGNGVDTFNLPDYRGRFLRGVDDAAGRDPDHTSRTAPKANDTSVTGGLGNAGNAVGSVQGDQIQHHLHPVSDPGHWHPPVADTILGAGGGSHYVSGASVTVGGQGYGQFNATGTAVTKISVQESGGNESRPINAAVNYIIKY